MMKKSIFCLVCLAVLLSWSFCAAYAEGERLVLPWSLQVIGKEAYAGDSSLDEVVLPEGLTSIGAKAFASSSVMRVYSQAD